MRTLVDAARRRRRQVIVINPLREVGLVQFPRAHRRPRACCSARTIAGSLRAAAHRRRHRVPQRRGEGACSSAARVDARSSTPTPTDGERSRRDLARCDWETIVAIAAACRATIDGRSPIYCARSQAHDLLLGDGHHPPRARRRERAGDRQPRPACAAWSAARARGCCRCAATRNVQGIGSMGVTPQLKEAVFESLEARFGVHLPTSDGLDTLACMRAQRTRAACASPVPRRQPLRLEPRLRPSRTKR